MSLNREAREYHDQYESANAHTRLAVDDAFTAARNSLTAYGIPPLGDDRAEILVAAIMKYVIACRGVAEKEKAA